jgi:hypothetical protein
VLHFALTLGSGTSPYFRIKYFEKALLGVVLNYNHSGAIDGSDNVIKHIWKRILATFHNSSGCVALVHAS